MIMAFCMYTVCNKDHGCKYNSHCDDNDLLGEMAQFTVGERGAMREPFSQSENTAGERDIPTFWKQIARENRPISSSSSAQTVCCTHEKVAGA